MLVQPYLFFDGRCEEALDFYTSALGAVVTMVQSRCAGEWGGWGRLSEDGPGQHNPDPSEGPWGGG